jgi:hypothetical protein
MFRGLQGENRIDEIDLKAVKYSATLLMRLYQLE